MTTNLKTGYLVRRRFVGSSFQNRFQILSKTVITRLNFRRLSIHEIQGRSNMISHFFSLYTSLNIRSLHCTQEAEYVVSFCCVFQDVLSLTSMTLFSKVRPLSGCIMKLHYFRFILPPFLHTFTVRKLLIILSVFLCFQDVSSLT